MNSLREQIVARAHEFIGTPFRHQGREKGKAIDCVGIPLIIGEELSLRDRIGNPFTRQDHLNYSSAPGDEIVLEICRQRLVEKAQGARIEPGDILCIKSPRVPTHAGIAAPMNLGTCGVHMGMIHALDIPGLRRVVFHILDNAYLKRIRAVFSFPGTDAG